MKYEGPHDKRSVELYKFIAELDFEEGGDRFCFKSGGDGDNGEHLMYLLDAYFTRNTPPPDPPGDSDDHPFECTCRKCSWKELDK